MHIIHIIINTVQISSLSIGQKRMLEQLNLEIAVTLYIVILSISALTTLFSSLTRPLSEYGKLLSNRTLNCFYISKTKYFGHMYILAIFLNSFTLLNIYSYLTTGHKSSFTTFMSTNAPSVASNDLSGIRLSYECICTP